MKKLLLLAALLCLPKVRAAVPPAEKLLPEDTQFVICIPDFAKAREIYRTSPQTLLWQDPAMKAFREKFLAKIREEEIAPLEHELGVSFDDYTNLPQGQVTFALVPTPDKGKDVPADDAGILLLLDTKDKSSQLRTNLAELRKKWVDAGKPLRTEKIRDLEFSVIAAPPKEGTKVLSTVSVGEDADTVKPAPKVEYFIGQAESLLIVGNSGKVIEKVLAALAGASVKTLDDVPAYAANHGALFRQAALFAWVNAKPWVDGLRHQDDDVKEIEPENNPFSFKWEKVISATGLGGLKSIAASYVHSPEGAEFNVAFSAPESGRTGIFKILASEPKDCNPPNFVPADAIKFQRWRLDGQKTWAVLQKMVGDISPQWLNGLNFFLTMAETSGQLKDPDFSIKKNLIGNLGDDFISYAKAPTAGSGAEPAAILLIGSPNGEQLASAFKGIFAMMGQPGSAPAEREFRGHKIYSIPQPSLPGVPGASGAPQSLNYAASGGYLALSSDAGILEEYLRSSENQEKTLRETPGLADSMQRVMGGGTSLFGFSNGSEDMRAAFAALKKNPNLASTLGAFAPLAAAAAALAPPGEGKPKEWFDYSLLPPFDDVAKYFYFTVYGGSANQDGLQLKVFVPVPPQLKNR